MSPSPRKTPTPFLQNRFDSPLVSARQQESLRGHPSDCGGSLCHRGNSSLGSGRRLGRSRPPRPQVTRGACRTSSCGSPPPLPQHGNCRDGPTNGPTYSGRDTEWTEKGTEKHRKKHLVSGTFQKSPPGGQSSVRRCPGLKRKDGPDRRRRVWYPEVTVGVRGAGPRPDPRRSWHLGSLSCPSRCRGGWFAVTARNSLGLLEHATARGTAGPSRFQT